MFFKKYFFFLFFLFNSLLILSQNTESKSFTLEWNDNSIIQLNKDKSIILPLVYDNFFDGLKLPTFTHLFKVQNNVILREYQINNVKYSTLPQSSLRDIDIKDIPKEIKSDFTLTKIKDKPVAVFTLSPLVNENGRIKKIISFNLDYSLNDKVSTNSSNKSALNFVNNSVLSGGTWYKFRVDTTGVFKIDKKLLQEIGISTSGLIPR